MGEESETGRQENVSQVRAERSTSGEAGRQTGSETVRRGKRDRQTDKQRDRHMVPP